MTNPKTLTRRDLLKQASLLILTPLLPWGALIPPPVPETKPKRIIARHVEIYFSLDGENWEILDPEPMVFPASGPVHIISCGAPAIEIEGTTAWANDNEWLLFDAER